MSVSQWRLSSDARRDLRGIARYTKKRWGKEQVDRYNMVLDATFDRLVEYPESGRERPSLRAGMRIMPVERHLVVYRVEPQGVLIMRVVHQSMDLTGMDLN